MHLGFHNSAKNKFDILRDLTGEEMEQHAKFTPLCAEARERLALFRMLDRNYVDWKAYLNRLLSTTFKEDVDVKEELDRLLLNYLTFAYTIEQHFNVSFRQRFKKDAATLKKYEDFLDRLCKASWPFAFILDYRGYVQHVELGISWSNRVMNDTSVRIEVMANAKALLAASRQWKRSGLTIEKGDLDLVGILKEFHVQMIQSYAVFVAKTFFPELQPASEFYARLTKEVQERDPNARMIFFSKKPESTPEKGGKVSINWSVVYVANDLFAELGIKVKKV
jgi:hypothetical protein